MIKKYGRHILCCLLLAVLLVGLVVPAEAAHKLMECRQADIAIFLDEDGGAWFTETWTCDFSGDMISRYHRQYDNPDPAECTLEIYEVKMDGEPMTILDEPDDDRPEGCAAIYEEGNTTHLQMYMAAENDSHTFEITYYISNVVILYNDVAEFHWNLSSEHESFDIDYLTGYIEIPYGTRDKGLYFWGHGPTKNADFYAIEEDGMVNRFELYSEDVPQDRAVTVRFAMPLELFPNGSRFIDTDALDMILEEEHQSTGNSNVAIGNHEPYTEDPDEPYGEDDGGSWYYELHALFSVFESIFFVLWCVVAIVVGSAPLIILLAFSWALRRHAERSYLPKIYARYRQKPAVAPQYYRNLPDRMKPAVVYKLMSVYPIPGEGKEIKAKGNAFSATVLDLVESGLIQMSTNAEGEAVYYVVPGASRAALTDYENNIIELYTTAGAGQRPMTTKEITDYMRTNYSWCKQQYRQFGEAVDNAFEASALSQDYPSEELNNKKMNLLWIVCGAVMFIGLHRVLGLIGALVLGGCVGFLDSRLLSGILSTAHPEYSILTQEGENRYALWKAYANFLNDFTAFDQREVGDVKIWRKYLVYATALGCSERVIENLKMYLPEVYQSFESDPYLYHYEDMYSSVSAIDTEGGYTIRSSSSSDDGSSDSGDWGGFSDSGGDTDSGSSGSDYD